MPVGHLSLTARIIFSLSALAASLFAGVGRPAHPLHDPVPRLLRPQLLGVAFVLSASERTSQDRPFIHTPDATFDLAILAASPFRSSLWLVSSFVAIDFIARRHQRKFLRC
jgi:hypothetical protein